MSCLRSIKLGSGMRRLGQDESGQSLIIVALAIIALLAIIGLGVDLGLVYVERVRLSRAMDAAALAGAQELPSEEAAHQRAVEYLIANGYDAAAACVETHGSTLGRSPGACDGAPERTKIIVNTTRFRDDGQQNTANRIRVEGTQSVDLTFVRVIGFNEVPVSASSTAENIEDLDIVIVYDRSGSMQEDTRCYGCWEPDPVLEYPAGTTYPLPYTIVPTTGLAVHCQPSEPLNWPAGSSDWYISIEAEHYSRYLIAADYHRDRTEYPKTWWTMQRQPNTQASGPDDRGAFMKVGPHSEYVIHVSTLNDILHPPDLWTTPRLDYDFTVPADGTYYVWMRAQGGVDWWENALVRRSVHVGLNDFPMATGVAPMSGPYGANGGAASPDSWGWSRVLTLSDLNATGPDDPYTLNFWAAGPGFSLDKIVITNSPRTNLDRGNRPLAWDYPGVADAGPVETHGRTDWACMGALDPRFGPIDPLTGDLDDLYDDAQPIRAAKEAAKNFVRRLNPELDQIGYVWYSSEASIREELYCLKQIGSCDNFDNVLAAIDSTFARGSTNIGDAIWDGMRVLTTGRESTGGTFPPKQVGAVHYGRPSAAHIMVLMTDGLANEYPKDDNDEPLVDCFSDDLWDDVPGETQDQRRARECVVWFAERARDQGTVIYTIGLGSQADSELLAYVADLTGGWYYYAPSADELDAIFESLYERIFLRLTD